MAAQTTLKQQVFFVTALRLVVNTPLRMVYPFLAYFAAGMNKDISMISLAVGISMATSAFGPFIAPIADRRGRKVGMLIGTGIFLVGTIAASLFPGYATFFLAILLGNLGNNILIPALQAYLGDRVPYARRGFYLAFTELSWALSFILMVPLAGLLIRQTTWVGPFIAVSILGVIMFFLLWKLIPSDTPKDVQPLDILADIRIVLAYPPAVYAILMGTLFITGNEVVNIISGVWMQDVFQLQIAALGAASFVIGISELSGEGLAALLADRLGKERTIAISLILNALWVVTLPWLGKSLPGAFVWLFIFYLTFELAIISSLPLMTEITPATRATMMSLFIAFLSLGRAVGDLVAPWIYRGGFLMNALVCVGLDLLALLALSRIRIKRDNPSL